MRAFAEWTDRDLVLVLEGVDRRIAERLGFTDGRRTFPRDAPYAAQAAERFQVVAETMVQQVADLEPVPWEAALEPLVDRLDGCTIVGSVARALRGEEASPHDIDFVCDIETCERLAEALADLLVEPLVDGGWIGGRWFRAFGGARIEGVGDFSGTVVDEEVVEWRGRELRVGRVA
jgi:hypothetical protein